MIEAEFDKFADEYHAMHLATLGASGEGPEYFAAYKIKDLAWEYARRCGAGHAPPRILDFGCGSGNSVGYLKDGFPGADITCIDVSRKSLDIASARFPGAAQFATFDGRVIPFDAGQFDIVFAACVFHHIDHAEHANLFSEWLRVLRPGGVALVYEHNPYNPLTRRVVDRCPFDENAHLIRPRDMQRRLAGAGFAAVDVEFRVFFPRIVRALRRWERALSGVPLGAQYYAAATRPSA